MLIDTNFKDINDYLKQQALSIMDLYSEYVFHFIGALLQLTMLWLSLNGHLDNIMTKKMDL